MNNAFSTVAPVAATSAAAIDLSWIYRSEAFAEDVSDSYPSSTSDLPGLASLLNGLWRQFAMPLASRPALS